MKTMMTDGSNPLLAITGTYILMVACIVMDCAARFGRLAKLDRSMAALCGFNTSLEADLVIDRLKMKGITGIAINTRVLAVSGALSYWELCAPSVPYFITHRGLAGGSDGVREARSGKLPLLCTISIMMRKRSISGPMLALPQIYIDSASHTYSIRSNPFKPEYGSVRAAIELWTINDGRAKR